MRAPHFALSHAVVARFDARFGAYRRASASINRVVSKKSKTNFRVLTDQPD
jgi:hypothetical protein